MKINMIRQVTAWVMMSSSLRNDVISTGVSGGRHENKL
jgi:hypothetical protein